MDVPQGFAWDGPAHALLYLRVVVARLREAGRRALEGLLERRVLGRQLL